VGHIAETYCSNANSPKLAAVKTSEQQQLIPTDEYFSESEAEFLEHGIHHVTGSYS